MYFLLPTPSSAVLWYHTQSLYRTSHVQRNVVGPTAEKIWRKADVIGPTGHYCQHNSCAAASRDATRNLEQGLVELRPVMPEGAQALPALPPEIWVKNLSSLPFTDRYVRRCMCRQMQRPLLALLNTFCWCRLATIPLVCKAWKKIAQPACPIWQSCEIKDGAAKPLDLVKVMR